MSAPVTSPLLACLSDQITESGIQRWWWKGRKKGAPVYLSLVVGGDERSCGASLHVWSRNDEGMPAGCEPLVAVRWRQTPETAEDVVLLAQKALRAVAFERGWAVAE